MSSPRKAKSTAGRVSALPLPSAPPLCASKRPSITSTSDTLPINNKKKKSKTNSNHGSPKSGGSSGTTTKQAIMAELSYEPLTLADIQTRMLELCQRVPPALNAEDDEDVTHEQTVEWASQMQCILEGFNLLLSCVSPATYIWSTKRSGAADQHLSVLSSELQLAQEALSSMVSPRLSNLLAPVVDVVVDTITTTTPPAEDNSGSEKPLQGNEIKVQKHTYTSRVVDPDYLKLSGEVARRNSPMLRHVLLATILKSHQCITDYSQAVKDEEGRSANMGYSY